MTTKQLITIAVSLLLTITVVCLTVKVCKNATFIRYIYETWRINVKQSQWSPEDVVRQREIDVLRSYIVAYNDSKFSYEHYEGGGRYKEYIVQIVREEAKIRANKIAVGVQQPQDKERLYLEKRHTCGHSKRTTTIAVKERNQMNRLLFPIYTLIGNKLLILNDASRQRKAVTLNAKRKDLPATG